MHPEVYRVIQWGGTGRVGIQQLRGVLEHPRLELVGLRTYSEEKEGVDAGTLCGRDAVGVRATRNVEQLLDLAADCVCVGATNVHGLDAVIDEECRMLGSGKNVVSVTGSQLVYPPLLPEVTARLEQACRVGGTSMYVGGSHPGFMNDILPAVVTSGCQRVDSIATQEYIDLSDYPDQFVMRDGIGFGATPESDAETAEFRLGMAEFWVGSGVRNLAQALRVEIDEVQPFREVVLADDSFDVPACHIAKGTIAAVHFGLRFLVAGKTRITLHDYLRVAPDPAYPWPEGWPPAPGGTGGYVVEIEGMPTMRVELSMHTKGSNNLTDAEVFTGMRVVNAIPAVCEAEPGVHTFLTLGQDVFGAVNWRD